MSSDIKNLFLLPALITGLGLSRGGRVTAQTFSTLYSFTATSGSGLLYTNSDGANPVAGLILSDNTLYGTAGSGGSSANGTVFKVNTDGTSFTTLVYFTGTDGSYPSGGLVLSGKILYGTTVSGGGSDYGTVFAVNTNGTGLTNLYDLTGSEGGEPYAGLILSGNKLYGTLNYGGSSGYGAVFRIDTDGTGFTNLHRFAATSGPLSTNSDGAYPSAGLILSCSTLYGTAQLGGSSGWGTVFKLNTDGTGFVVLHSFTGGDDGYEPYAGLFLSGNSLYGTASGGGSWGTGTVLKVNTDGTGFATLHNFTRLSSGTNSDGAYPYAGLTLIANALYGTTYLGGSSGYGTVFKVNTDGTGFTTLHNFTALLSNTNCDGANPIACLVLSGNTLYGTAQNGGSSGNGTVFSLFVPPQLTIIPCGANVILTWPTNAAGFNLQSTTNLVSPTVWTNVSPAPALVNGQNAVTNPFSAAQMFYRLSQ